MAPLVNVGVQLQRRRNDDDEPAGGTPPDAPVPDDLLLWQRDDSDPDTGMVLHWGRATGPNPGFADTRLLWARAAP